MSKNSSHLTINDFHNSRIWTWEDDDDKVIPVQYDNYIPDDLDAVFVGCNLIFQDGTTMKGVIAVRVSDHQVYLVSFPYENENLINIPLQPLLRLHQEEQLEKLCRYYEKVLSSIFPLRYESNLKFSDGAALIGSISL
jgi:hypothetical protein